MNIKNCRKCGRMFQTLSDERICKECKGRLEEKFQEVKAYIQENRQATLQEISHACDVTVKQIEQWVREERLFFSEDSPVKIRCEGCGREISSGRYCSECIGKFRQATGELEPKQAENKTESRQGIKMHILGDRRGY